MVGTLDSLSLGKLMGLSTSNPKKDGRHYESSHRTDTWEYTEFMEHSTEYGLRTKSRDVLSLWSIILSFNTILSLDTVVSLGYGLLFFFL